MATTRIRSTGATEQDPLGYVLTNAGENWLARMRQNA